MDSRENAKIAEHDMVDAVEVSVVMPCLNEEGGIASCINKAKAAIRSNKLKAEIVVVDNGSTDRSVEIARNLGARVLIQNEKGYGRAYQMGISQAKGKYIVIGDSDDTYDFSIIMKFIDPLRTGYEFVNGSRLKGAIHKGAMPLLHRYLGNPVLSFILNLFFGSGFSDVYCGMKAFSKEAYLRMKPVSPGMEFALELIINASGCDLKRTEIPVQLHPRKGESKLRTFRDGWRSLRFMLLYCPNYLFIVPGGLTFLAGLVSMVLLLKGPVSFAGHTFDFQAMIFASMMTLLGFQLINLGFFAKSYALAEGYERKSRFYVNFCKVFDLEKGILAGGMFILAGLIIASSIIRHWMLFGPVTQERKALLAATVIVIGIQTVFSSFLISLIGLKTRDIYIKAKGT